MGHIYKDKKSLIVQNNFVDWRTGELVSPVETADFTVVQVAESYFIGGFETKAHTQPCDVELTIPLIGSLSSFANEICERVEKNGVYISFKGEKHRLFSKSSCRLLTIAVNFKKSRYPILSEIRKQFSKTRTIPNGDPLSISSRIAAEFSPEARPFFEFYINALLNELFINLLRGANTENLVSVPHSEECLPEIINYIDCNFLNICSTEELCRFGYSYHYICRLFKETYGISPGAYLFSKRMEHATLSLSKGKSVSEISHLLGYSSPYNFSRAFKKHFGYPPSKITMCKNAIAKSKRA